MGWDRIRRISDAELSSEAGRERASVELDREPPVAWVTLFQRPDGPHPEVASGAAGKHVAATLAPGQDDDAFTAAVDARVQHTNLRYEAEVLSPGVIEVLGLLGARDPSDLQLRYAQTAGVEPDREEADRSTQVLSNEPALLVENEQTALSQPIDQALCAALLKAGCVDKR